MNCGHCGCALVAEKKKGKYVYYHCTGNKGKCPEPYAREEVLEACFADLLKGLVFDDQVMDWIVDALHQSHADEKRFRRDALARLQDEQSEIQNRLDKLYDDRLDGFIEPDFFERKATEWRQTQKRLADQIAEYENAAHDYVHDGVRLLELAKRPIFCSNSKVQAKNASRSILCVRTRLGRIKLSPQRFANRLIYLHLLTRLGKEKRPPERHPATFVIYRGSAYGTRTRGLCLERAAC